MLDKVIEDFIFLSGYDAIYSKKIPSMGQFGTNAINSIGTEYLSIPLLKMLNEKYLKLGDGMIIPIIGKIIAISLGDGIVQGFIMSSSGKWIDRESFMKGVLAVGAQSVYKNL